MAQNISTAENGLAVRRAYTIAEAAQLLGCHKVSVYRRIYAGEIKILKGFGRLIISEAELNRFLGDDEVYTPRHRRGYGKAKEAVAGLLYSIANLWRLI
jgi:excisionase family DNA binding protein